MNETKTADGMATASTATEQTVPDDDRQLLVQCAELGSVVRERIGNTVIGQHRVVSELLVSLFAGGHLLLIGVPGLAKTLLIRTLARTLGLSFSRIQFTPDLMPADITGTEILQQDPATGRRELIFRPGPVFANIVLADEINRTPPRTQAALLEAMQEHQVTTAGIRRPLPMPFFVFATQNPIELEGTYPLPEAQLDRFLFATRIGYPTEAEELEMIRLAAPGDDPEPTEAAAATASFPELLRLVQRIPVAEHLLQRIVRRLRATRPETTTLESVRRYVRFGASPRATRAVVAAARAHAALDARPCVEPRDIDAVLAPTLRHRILLCFAARAENLDVEPIIEQIAGIR